MCAYKKFRRHRDGTIQIIEIYLYVHHNMIALKGSVKIPLRLWHIAPLVTEQLTLRRNHELASKTISRRYMEFIVMNIIV